jgi:hypothetical protein
MTPARKAALEWFYDRGETRLSRHNADQPSGQMILAMIREGQLEWRVAGAPIYTLTDKGRRDLHEAGR